MGESTVITNKCPNCGGPLLFNPKDQKFHCEYCGSTFTENEVNQIAQKQADAGIKDPLGQTTTDVQASDEKKCRNTNRNITRCWPISLPVLWC